MPWAPSNPEGSNPSCEMSKHRGQIRAVELRWFSKFATVKVSRSRSTKNWQELGARSGSKVNFIFFLSKLSLPPTCLALRLFDAWRKVPKSSKTYSDPNGGWSWWRFTTACFQVFGMGSCHAKYSNVSSNVASYVMGNYGAHPSQCQPPHETRPYS